ncbi:MAG: tripartite tricarboxylate transporter substrate binding protein [Pseudomonadota bacterium]
MIVTYPPGGVTDIVGRIVADALAREVGQPVVIENRAGAGGNIGTLAAAQSEPDGLTLMLGTAAIYGVNPLVYPRSGVVALRDFTTIGVVGEVANVLSIVPDRLPDVRDAAGLIAEARRRPLTVGSVGNGSSSHLSATVLFRAAGIEATHVPYRGSAPLVAAMLAKEVDFAFDTTATSTAHVRSGGIRALGVTTARRAAALPEVPTLMEQGLSAFDLGAWFNVAVPVRTPAPIVAALSEALVRARTPQTDERLRGAFVDPLTIAPAETAGWIAASTARWLAITQEAGVALG